MGSYTALGDASSSIIELLRDTVSPEPINKPETIGICQPNERGDFVLGLCLYDIRENEMIRNRDRIKLDSKHYKEPPLSFTLYYMIFVHQTSEIMSRNIDEQRILGKVIQQLNNYRSIPEKYLVGSLKEGGEKFNIIPNFIPIEEKIKIWSLFNKPYKTSYFYQVDPIFMDTEIIRQSSIVTNAEFNITRK